MKDVIKSLYPEPGWKKRGVGWFAGTSDRGCHGSRNPGVQKGL